MKKVNLILCCFLVFSFACTKKEKRTYKEPVKPKKEVGPTYMAYYHPDSVVLEKVQYSDSIDQITAIRLIVNSSKEIKADYLNYLMDTYKTTSPEESRLEPLFDAEHIAKFLVWQYVNESTDEFFKIFHSIYLSFEHGDAETKTQLIRYSLLQGIILESRHQNVNYNVVFLPWLGGVKQEFYELLDEMETGRS